jgi:hypothetical protein
VTSKHSDYLANPDTSVLMRCTYVSPAENPLNTKGRAHPQSPPLHLHFDQSESFLVAQGEVCTTEGYGVEERTWTPEDGVRLVEPWMPYVSLSLFTVYTPSSPSHLTSRRPVSSASLRQGSYFLVEDLLTIACM